MNHLIFVYPAFASPMMHISQHTPIKGPETVAKVKHDSMNLYPTTYQRMKS